MTRRSLVVGCLATAVYVGALYAQTARPQPAPASPQPRQARPATPAARPAQPQPGRSRDDPRSPGHFCRGSARVSQPVLHRLPQREDEGRRARLIAPPDDGRARSRQRGQGSREVGTGRPQDARGTDAAARREASGPGTIRRDDRVVREQRSIARRHRSRRRQDCIVSTAPSTRMSSAICSICRSIRASICRLTTRRPASTTSLARSASRPRWSRRTCRRRRRSAVSRWAIRRNRRSSSIARAKTRRRTITSRACRSARAAACWFRTPSRPTANTR